jgi:hypothetical protein
MSGSSFAITGLAESITATRGFSLPAMAQMSLNIRNSLVGALVASAALGAGACGGSDSSAPAAGTGNVVVQLTDAPFPTDSVKSADIFIVRIDGRASDADSSTSAKGISEDSASAGGWTTLAKPNATINLLAYQNGVTTTIGNSPLPAGTYQGFRLIIDASRSSISLKNGKVLSGTSNPGIMFPSAAQSGIKIELSQPLKISASQTSTLVVDFDLANSFVMRGNSISQNGLLFKPVVKATVK